MIGLILEGGGMRAGFVAGALMALMDQGLTGFDIAVAVSASVPTLAYFASGQRKEIERVWRNELHSPNLVCYRNIPGAFFILSNQKPVLNLHYLVYEVFKKKYPLNLENQKNSKMACYFVLTDVTGGQSVFLRPGDGDIYTIFEAALKVPGCYPKPIYIHGCEYMDGGITSLLPIHFLTEQKVDKMVAILSTPLDYAYHPLNLIERALLWRYFRKNQWISKQLKEASQIYEKERSLLKQLAEKDSPRAFIISPDKMPPARFITRNRKKINQTVDLGYRKAKGLEKEIDLFLHPE